MWAAQSSSSLAESLTWIYGASSDKIRSSTEPRVNLSIQMRTQDLELRVTRGSCPTARPGSWSWGRTSSSRDMIATPGRESALINRTRNTGKHRLDHLGAGRIRVACLSGGPTFRRSPARGELSYCKQAAAYAGAAGGPARIKPGHARVAVDKGSLYERIVFRVRVPLRARDHKDRSAMCYARRGPLLAYTNVAVLEATNYTSDSVFWRQLYKPLEAVTCHYGWRGVAFDCITLSMGASAGDDDDANVEARIPANEHDGVLDSCYTLQTKGGGRALAFGTYPRVEMFRTRELIEEIVSSALGGVVMGSGDWVLRWRGFTCNVTIECAFVPEGPYVDMMAICDTLMFAVLMFPKRTEEPEQYSCFPLPTEPFFTTEPKETLGIQMATQGLGLHPVKGDAVIVSLGETKPLVVTSYMDALLRTSTPGQERSRRLHQQDAQHRRHRVHHGGVGGVGKSGDQIANVCMIVKELKIGDKLMGHGIKFKVGKLIPRKDMPTVVEDVTGEGVMEYLRGARHVIASIDCPGTQSGPKTSGCS
ncbi:hypothetical protein DL771_010893 [Monosporascus sp. 5C6A]|nr:hypothetical protein DL771_010893 [Monosporascus sp. 5C6A]